MCYKVKCKKSTWGGCGKHLDQVFKIIPHTERSWCNYDLKEVNKLIKIAQKNNTYGPFPIHTKPTPSHICEVI